MLAAVAGCSVSTTVSTPESQALESRAAAAAASGDFATAISAYRQLAMQSRGTTRAGYLLEGASLLLDAGDSATAALWLEQAAPDVNGEQQQQLSVLSARVDVAENRPEAALAKLATVQAPVPVDLSRDMAAVRGDALFALGRRAEAVREYVDREIWLDSAEEILANQQAIWDGLRTAPGPASEAATGDPIVDGWLALEPLARAQDDAVEFRRALLEWRGTYLEHPAAGGLLAELLDERRAARTDPGRIALLLPLSGEFRDFAVAIRDGFFAAHLGSDNRRETTIRVYDTSSDDIQAVYSRAQLEGADFIVGPLLRQNVEAVMPQAGFIPTLALNFSETEPPFVGNFHQFAQWPEDEASAVAARAYAEGARTAVALVASDAFGYRLLDAFRDSFEALGGRLLLFNGFEPSMQDFTGQIESMLNIARSEQRHRRLQANLNVPLAFEARSRQDVDMIFLGVDSPQSGRLLVPQLRFVDEAGEVPVYATHDIYDPGVRSPDSDLNGVIFADLPLLIEPSAAAVNLRRELEANWPNRADQRIRYYGMGYDAFELMRSLYSPGGALWPLHGVSGELSPDELGRIHRRQVSFAQMRAGRPVALPAVTPPTLPMREPILGSR